MKNLVMTAAALIIAAHANAETKWVSTPFWQTAYVTDYKLDLKVIADRNNASLAEDCRDFDRRILDESSPVHITDRSDFQLWNEMNMTSDLDHLGFYLELKVLIGPSMELANLAFSNPELKTLTDEKARTDVVEHYTQNPNSIVLKPESFSSPMRIERDNKSLRAAGERFGIAPGPITMADRADGKYLVLNSKEIACDLLAGRLNFNIKGKAAVRISGDSYRPIMNHYQKIEEISNRALQQSSKPAVRAALLGFKLGQHFSQTQSQEQAETQLLALLPKIFDLETMNRSNIWSNGVSGPVLDVNFISPVVDVNVQLVGKR